MTEPAAATTTPPPAKRPPTRGVLSRRRIWWRRTGARPSPSFFFADSCEDARAVLEALHVGVDGVVLRTEDPGEARALAGIYPPRRVAASTRLRPRTPTRAPHRRKTLLARNGARRGDPRGGGGCGRPRLRGLHVRGVSARRGPAGGLVRARACSWRTRSACLRSGTSTPGRSASTRGRCARTCCSPEGARGTSASSERGTRFCASRATGTGPAKTVGRVKIERRQMVLVEATLVDGDCENTVDDDDEDDDGDDALCVDTPEGLKRRRDVFGSPAERGDGASGGRRGRATRSPSRRCVSGTACSRTGWPAEGTPGSRSRRRDGREVT